MPALQVRDLPSDLYDQLKIAAHEEQRSLAQETIVALRAYLATRSNDASDVSAISSETYRARHLAALNAIKQIEPFDIPAGYADEADVLRELRDEREGDLTATDIWEEEA